MPVILSMLKGSETFNVACIMLLLVAYKCTYKSIHHYGGKLMMKEAFNY